MFGRQLKRSLLILIVAALSFFPEISRAESPFDILVITNKNVDSKNTIDLSMLKAIFIKDVWFWGVGGKVNALNAPSGSALRESFRKRVLQWTRAEETEYWQDQQVSRGVVRPPEFRQTLRAVFAIKGSIGYVFRKDFHENVARVVLVIPATKP